MEPLSLRSSLPPPRRAPGCGLALFMIMLLCGGATALTTARTLRFVSTAHAATGKVLFLVEDSEERETTVYRPRIAYPAPFGPPGGTIHFTSKLGASHSSYEPGDLVPVLYDPADPWNRAEINTFLPLWGLTAFFGGATAFCLTLGLLLKNSVRTPAQLPSARGCRIVKAESQEF